MTPPTAIAMHPRLEQAYAGVECDVYMCVYLLRGVVHNRVAGLFLLPEELLGVACEHGDQPRDSAALDRADVPSAQHQLLRGTS